MSASCAASGFLNGVPLASIARSSYKADSVGRDHVLERTALSIQIRNSTLGPKAHAMDEEWGGVFA